ncbi:hypothetical protein F5141DRAFT_802903 [Pisolithus sp. B1]|nr:hypothetical protein F5141DRAFT_802903 [Pisolithus sp. B1]
MSSDIEWLYIDELDSLKTYSAEIPHVAAYILRLRSRWGLENLQTTVPAHWLRLLALHGEKCVHEQAIDCPLQGLSPERQTKSGQTTDSPRASLDPSFPPSCESYKSEVPETQGGPVLDTAISEISACTGRESNVSMSIACLLTSIPGCKLQRDPNHTRSADVSSACPLDFALFSPPLSSESFENQCLDAAFSKPPFVMLGMKGPAYWQYQVDARLQESSLARLRQDMASHARPHLSNLVARLDRISVSIGGKPVPRMACIIWRHPRCGICTYNCSYTVARRTRTTTLSLLSCRRVTLRRTSFPPRKCYLPKDNRASMCWSGFPGFATTRRRLTAVTFWN